MTNSLEQGLGYFAWCWAVIGFFAALFAAIWNLVPHVASALGSGLSLFQWVVLTLNVCVMAYYEGIKGFQRSFSPQYAARARSLLERPDIVKVILAPIYCMGFFAAPKKKIISTFALTFIVICFVLVFKRLPQPWRGILDCGVVVGLTWGSIATAYYLLRPALYQPNQINEA